MFPKVNILWIPAILLSLVITAAWVSCHSGNPSDPTGPNTPQVAATGSIHETMSSSASSEKPGEKLAWVATAGTRHVAK